MRLTQEELARRLRAARESAGLTQEAVARRIGIPRSAVAQIEAGARRVSGLELAQLAYLYGRSIQDFLAPEFAQNGVTVLLRALPEAAEEAEMREAVLNGIAIAREIANLEELLGTQRLAATLPSYHYRLPRSRWDAIAQGRALAHQERQRLELGIAPLLDPAEVLESQGLAVLELRLPTGLSGFTVRFDGRVICGLNVGHPTPRQRFSVVHEYCHALVDHDQPGIVSSRETIDDLREVRANAFAIYFLAPTDAIEHALQSLSKGFPKRPRAAVAAPDETEVEVVEGRLSPRSQEMGLWHACWLAARFGVSTEAMIWHLFNLKLIDEMARARLHEAAQSGLAGTMSRWFERQDPERRPIAPLRLAHRRLAGLALDAFRRDLISRTKLVELLRLADVDDDGIEALISLVEPDETKAASAEDT